jgi:hypothetical protein
MNKKFLIFSLLVSQAVLGNINQTSNVFDCFSAVDSYDYSRSLTGRNRGFDYCLKKFPVPNPEIYCSSLADRYYGLSFKNRAMNTCIKRTTTVDSCLNTADKMTAVTLRSTEAMKCLKRFESTLTEAQCYRVGSKYHHIKRHSNQYCQNKFADKKMNTQGSNADYLGSGKTEIIKI